MTSRRVDEEATLSEVLAEVTLLDVGRELRGLLMGMGCMGLMFAVFLGVGAVVSAAGFGIEIPAPLADAGAVLLFAAIFLTQRSYHQGRWAFYFPKLSWLGLLTTTIYGTVCVQAMRFALGLPEGAVASLVSFGLYMVLVMPVVVFIGLATLGHKRLMDKRHAAVS